MMRALTLAVVASLLPATGFTQAATRRVFVDATATTGRTVTDLRAEEFEITENGELRDISLAKLGRRPARVVLIVDSTDAIRQPIGTIRKALAAFVEELDPQIEMMLVSVAGTPQVRVRPTLERESLVKSVNNIFGTAGSNRMHRIIDDLFHRFAQTTDYRPIFVVVTAEGFESTENINPQEIKHLTDHFAARGGFLHAVRLLVPGSTSSSGGGAFTELPVSLMIGRATGGAYTNISPAGLLEVLQKLATGINDSYTSTLNYQIEFTSAQASGKKPAPPQVRVLREGVELNVIFTP